MKVQDFLRFIPHARALGIEMLSADDEGGCVMRQPWREELIGDPVRNAVHGGVITTLLDTLGGHCVVARGVIPQATLDLRIDYLRPATFGLDLVAEGQCYHTTRHVAFVRATCHQGDRARPIANMTAAFVLDDSRRKWEPQR